MKTQNQINYAIRTVRKRNKDENKYKVHGKICTIPKEFIGKRVLIVPLNEYQHFNIRLLDRCSIYIYNLLHNTKEILSKIEKNRQSTNKRGRRLKN